jgi:Leucine zipper with capping helix domain/Mnd1 HTH domain
VDDGLVEKEKIGGSNFFWSFPAKKQRLMELKFQQTEETIVAMKIKVEEAKTRLADAKRGREDEDGERSKKLAKLDEMANERKALEAELEQLKENDPQAIADLEKELYYVNQGAHRWTDNIWNIVAYLTEKKNMEKKQVYRLLNITEEFDCKFARLD